MDKEFQKEGGQGVPKEGVQEVLKVGRQGVSTGGGQEVSVRIELSTRIWKRVQERYCICRF